MSDASADVPDDPIDGGCICGAVRYRIAGPVLSAGICHCLSCRRAAGAESVAWLTIATGDFRLLAGELATYHSSPGVTRGFCPRCGTSLTFAAAEGGSIDVTLASLDDPERVRPTKEWWLSHRLSWNPANPDLVGFPESGSVAS
jgi:hypothetical protein